MSISTAPVGAITVAGRHRKDFGDLDALAASIREVGLLQPVVVTNDHHLVAGERRLRVVRQLGWDTVPVHVIDSLDDAAKLLKAERDENICRKAMTPTEEESLYRALLKIEQPKAAERLAEGRKRGGEVAAGREAPAKVSHEPASPRRAKAAAAEAATGRAGRARTLEKVTEVRSVAEDDAAPAPIRSAAQDALAEMDATGKVDGAYKQFKRERSDAEHVTQLVAEFPDLAFYADQGRTADVLRLGNALRGYVEPERTHRIETLRRSIAAIQRRPAPEPAPEPEPDWVGLADQMFTAHNQAARISNKAGSAETIRAAIALVDPLTVQMWQQQFAQTAEIASALADAARASVLRRVK